MLDDFESGDTNWTSYEWFSPGYQISADWLVAYNDSEFGQSYRATGFGNTLAHYTPTQFADVSVSADMKISNISAGGAHCSIVARWSPITHTSYEFGLRSSDHGDHMELDLVILKMYADENRDVTIATITPYVLEPGVDFIDWVHLELRVVGTALQGFLNGQLLLEATDSEFTSGYAGVMEGNHGDWVGDYMIAWADNFRITDPGPVASQATTWSRIKQQFGL
jgi:hypothetical protein